MGRARPARRRAGHGSVEPRRRPWRPGGHPADEPARVRRDGDGLHEARRHRRADQRPVHRARAGLRDRQRRLLGGGDRAGPGRGPVAHGRASGRACPSSTPTTARSTRRASPAAAPHESSMEPDDPLFICYTSGTTGDPKGAVLTHRSWHYAALCRALQGGINLHDRLLLPFPLAFTGGLAMMLTALWSGSMLVLERAFDPTRCLRLIEELRITVFMAVPVDLPAARRSPRVRCDRHLLDPLRVQSGRDRTGVAAADVDRPRHPDDPDLLAHRGERVRASRCRTTRPSPASGSAACRPCTARPRSSTRTATSARPTWSARSPSRGPR